MVETTEARGRAALTASEALPKDVGRGIARMDPEVLTSLGLGVGDLVEISGKRAAYARAMPTYPDLRGRGLLQIDGLTRENARCGLGEKVRLVAARAEAAAQVVLQSLSREVLPREERHVAGLLDGLPVQEGDRLRATLFGSRWIDFKVRSTRPQGVVVIRPTTLLRMEDDHAPTRSGPGVTYEDIGGLGRHLERVREMIELPLKYPRIFARLGIAPPKGVLLFGPPGTGKTLIARAVANETEATFHSISGPEIIHKFYGESEAHLRQIFEAAAKNPPAVIFLDEIDAIAPKRDKVVGDVEKRVVAQLLALMDGLSPRGQVVVIGATNLPDALDPALRRPGRFDREIELPIPDRNGRRQILEIHSRGMPLAEDVDLDHLAGVSHGFVGADLAALCREAAMSCLRSIVPDIDLAAADIPEEKLQSLSVCMAHFLEALRQIQPSALREVFTEIPDASWKDVGGLDLEKQALTEAVLWPLRHGPRFAEMKIAPPRGILLTGRPGMGKTLLARALAGESGVNFICVRGPQLLSMYVGESERAVREVFRKARQAAPCVLFFDEIDSLLARRGDDPGDSRVAERVVSQFLVEADGIEELQGVFILGATSRADLLDPAVLRPGRFDRTIEIRPPSAQSLREIYAIHTRGKPLAGDVDLGELAAASSGMTGAEVAGACRQAAYAAIRRAIQAEGPDPGEKSEPGEKAERAEPGKRSAPLLVTMADFRAALEERGEPS